MKISQSLIAAAVIVALPLSAFAGDKDKTPAPMGSTATAQFNLLDTNSDGRISQAEAVRDPKIVFASIDKNSDGFIDTAEFAHRGTMKDSTMPSTGEPAQPRQ
jgi:hypothetical protein